MYSAVQCSAVQCSAVQCSAVQCSAVQCSLMQFSAGQCSKTLEINVCLHRVNLRSQLVRASNEHGGNGTNQGSLKDSGAEPSGTGGAGKSSRTLRALAERLRTWRISDHYPRRQRISCSRGRPGEA